MTGDEFLNFIRNDGELVELIQNSPSINKIYRSRKKSKTSQAGLARNHFLESLDGARFCLLLERKLGGQVAIGLMRGRNSKLRSALLLLTDEILQEKKL